MIPPFIRHLRQTMTYWPPLAGGLGPPEVFAPGSDKGGVRMTPTKRDTKFSREAERQSQPTVTALVQAPVEVGGVVAIGDHTGTPLGVAGIQEIIEYRETANLGDGYLVRRLIARPLVGQMRQTVTVYAMQRVDTDRGYVVARVPDAVYSGPASVDMLTGEAGGAHAFFASAAVAEHQAVVMVPYTAAIDAHRNYEIEWASPFGLIILEAQGPIFSNSLSAFWKALGCKVRLPET